MKFRLLSQLRVLLPVIMLVFLTLFILLMALYQRQIQEIRLVENKLEHVRQTLSFLKQEIEHNYLDPDRFGDSQRILMTQSVDSAIKVLAVINQSGQVLISNRFAWDDMQAQNVMPEFNKKLVEDVFLNKLPNINISSNGQTAQAYLPLSLSLKTDTLRSREHGVIYMSYDLAVSKAAIWHQVRRDSGIIWLLAVALMLGLISILDRLITQPLSRLASFSQQISTEQAGAQITEIFQGEIASLAHVLNQMSTEIAQTIFDISEQKENLAVTLDSIGDAVIATDSKGYVTRLNPVAENLTGWKTADAEGKLLPDVFEIISAITREPAVNPVEKVLTDGRIVGLANHTALLSKDGKEYQIADSAAPIKDKSGNIIGVVLVFRDVTEEYASQEELRQSYARLEAFGEALPDLAFIFDEDGKYLEVYGNQSATHADEVQRLIGKNVSEVFTTTIADRIKQTLQLTLTSNQSQTLEYQRETHQGSRWVEARTALMPKDETGPQQILWLAYDITSRKASEEESRSLGAVLGRSLNEIYIFDSKTLKFLYLNKGAQKNIGYSMSESRSLAPFDIKPEFNQKEFEAFLEPLRNRTQETLIFETIHQRKDGSHYPVEVRLQLQQYMRKPAFVAITLDITEQQLTRDALQTIITGTNKVTGDVFFACLTKQLSKAFTTEFAFIGVLSGEHNDHIKTLKVVNNGTVIDNFSYPLKGTPCNDVLHQRSCLYIDKVQSKFPEDHLLEDMHIDSYAGATIMDSEGNTLGLLVVMDPKPLKQPITKLNLLEVLAVRCGSELERMKAEADLRLTATAFNTHEAILITDSDAKILRVNEAFTELTGYLPDDVLNKKPSLMSSGKHDSDFYQNMWQELNESGRWEGEIWNKKKDGSVVPLWESITAVTDNDDNEVTHYVGNFVDISERKEAEAKIEYLAYFDSLTNLPNRRLLLDRLQQDFSLARRRNLNGALLFLDLDNFKNINDALGHSIGDYLLQQVGHRLTLELRDEDTVARLGGDEFVVLLPELGDNSEHAARLAQHIALKIKKSLNEVYHIQEHECHITPSIGIALFPEDVSNAETILKQADSAMYKSKADGRNAISFYHPDLQAAADLRLLLEKELRHAIEREELHLQFQPQVDNNNQLIGAEALLRWHHHDMGFISPAEFIPVAEETGLILQIGDWVLLSACQQAAKWRETHPDKFPLISINISSRQFRQSDFVEKTLRIIERTGVSPDTIVLEITEGIVIENVKDTIEKMNTLKQSGIEFSIDDFGTGYSSLAYLRQLPLSELKIDKTFVDDIVTDSNDAAIVETVIALALHLNLKVIAEGVENQAQMDLLVSKGCTSYQGYFFSKPLIAEDFFDFLSNME